MAEQPYHAVVQYQRGEITYQQMWDKMTQELPNGYYPLHEAARDGNIGWVRSMLEAGVNVNQRTSDGRYTALSFARLNRRQAVVDLLLQRGATDDTTANGTSAVRC